MALSHESFHTEAILFLKDEEVVNEMLHLEFDAVLDGVVGIPQCRSQTYHGAYVSISGGIDHLCHGVLQRIVSPKAFVTGGSDMCHSHRLKQLAEWYQAVFNAALILLLTSDNQRNRPSKVLSIC